MLALLTYSLDVKQPSERKLAISSSWFGFCQLLLCQPLKMHAPGLIAAQSFLCAAGPAPGGNRVQLSFGDLVPPFLLRGGPNLLFAAVLALERRININATQLLTGALQPILRVFVCCFSCADLQLVPTRWAVFRLQVFDRRHRLLVAVLAEQQRHFLRPVRQR